jgi:hypothetical protein
MADPTQEEKIVYALNNVSATLAGVIEELRKSIEALTKAIREETVSRTSDQTK